MKNLTFWFPSILFCFEFICSWKKRALRNNKKLKNWEIWQYNKLKIEGNQNVKFLVKQSPISNDSLLTLSMVEKFSKFVIKRSRCSVKSNHLQGMSGLLLVLIFRKICSRYSGYSAQKMKISIKDFVSKCNQIRRKLWTWSHLLKKSLIKNFLLFWHYDFW